MGLVARKPVFGVSDNASFKPVSSASETSWKIEISLVISLDMMLFDKRTTKALIRLRGCAGWSAPLLFANHRRQVFSRRGPNDAKQSHPSICFYFDHLFHHDGIIFFIHNCIYLSSLCLYLCIKKVWSLSLH